MRGTEHGSRSGTSAGCKAKGSAGTHAPVLSAVNKEGQPVAEHQRARTNFFGEAQHYVFWPGGKWGRGGQAEKAVHEARAPRLLHRAECGGVGWHRGLPQEARKKQGCRQKKRAHGCVPKMHRAAARGTLWQHGSSDQAGPRPPQLPLPVPLQVGSGSATNMPPREPGATATTHQAVLPVDGQCGRCQWQCLQCH